MRLRTLQEFRLLRVVAATIVALTTFWQVSPALDDPLTWEDRTLATLRVHGGAVDSIGLLKDSFAPERQYLPWKPLSSLTFALLLELGDLQVRLIQMLAYVAATLTAFFLVQRRLRGAMPALLITLPFAFLLPMLCDVRVLSFLSLPLGFCCLGAALFRFAKRPTLGAHLLYLASLLFDPVLLISYPYIVYLFTRKATNLGRDITLLSISSFTILAGHLHYSGDSARDPDLRLAVIASRTLSPDHAAASEFTKGLRMELERHPYSRDLQLALADSLRNEDAHTEEARNLYQSLLPHRLHRGDATLGLALIHIREGRADLAFPMLTELIRREPNRHDVAELLNRTMPQ